MYIHVSKPVLNSHSFFIFYFPFALLKMSSLLSIILAELLWRLALLFFLIWLPQSYKHHHAVIYF